MIATMQSVFLLLLGDDSIQVPVFLTNQMLMRV